MVRAGGSINHPLGGAGRGQFSTSMNPGLQIDGLVLFGWRDVTPLQQPMRQPEHATAPR